VRARSWGAPVASADELQQRLEDLSGLPVLARSRGPTHEQVRFGR